MTNDVTMLEPPGAPPQYACILNAQGRYLHDLLMHRTKGGWAGGWPHVVVGMLKDVMHEVGADD